ncbi:hypothetical protein NPIL_676821 [Nephila pilipes]|uniref:Uncharacterized protein n=1 Tax=Nephila pilipes TaxID=299642 RepID=A0A8X6NP48_NEPPI|nr:hypothetical protein NPIL_676821 [Nephila pilipes]
MLGLNVHIGGQTVRRQGAVYGCKIFLSVNHKEAWYGCGFLPKALEKLSHPSNEDSSSFYCIQAACRVLTLLDQFCSTLELLNLLLRQVILPVILLSRSFDMNLELVYWV